MSARLELMPIRQITGAKTLTFVQDLDEAVEVGGHTTAALVLNVLSVSGTAVVSLQTAIDNNTDHYVDLATFGGGGTTTGTQYLLCEGCSDARCPPGFGRYLRIKIVFTGSGDSLTLAVKGFAKP